jgi:hypothetical protein
MSKRVGLTNGVGRQWIQPIGSVGPVAFFPQPALEELFAVTEVGDMAVDKRKALQPVLDSIEKGWQIVKPSPLNPDDLETECIFQHRAAGHEQVRIVIDNSLFRLSNTSELQDLVRSVIKPGPNIYLARL